MGENASRLLVRIKPNPRDRSKFDKHSFRNRIRSFQVGNGIHSGKSVANSAIVTCDHIAGSIFIECVSVNHPVLVILKKWPELLNNQADEVFLKL